MNRFSPRRSVGACAAAALILATLVLSPPPAAGAQAAACPFNRIHDIQGAGHLSPCNGMSVSGVEGIVTAVRSSGYYIQDPNPDIDPPTGPYLASSTSEGIFIYTTTSGAKPNVGDWIEVSGTVLEFRRKPDHLTVTEIIDPTAFIVLSTGNSLPTPFIIGAGGTPVSDTIIDDDPEPNVETGGVFDPAPYHDAIDLYESLEGMRVQINDPVASSGTEADGQLPVIPEGGLGYFQHITGRGQLLRPNDPNPERIYLDDSHSAVAIPNVWAGTRFTGPATGVMHYDDANYRILLTQPLPANPHPGAGEPLDSLPAFPPGRLTVAAYNVENLSGVDDQARFDLLADQIVDVLAAPDLLALAEIQDDNGALAGLVSAGVTLSRLTAAIHAAGGPAYAWLQIDPEANHDGGETNANIRQVFLYNPARLQPAPAPAGDTTTAVALAPGAQPQLTLNPGRVNPGDPAFIASRKPLAAEFTFRGRSLFVIACHLNSKIDDQPLFGPNQPPLLSTEAKRGAQTAIINAFVRSILDRDPNAHILVLGDMNENDWAAPLATLKNGGDGSVELMNLAAVLPEGEPHYSYIYEGNAQAIDHIFASPAWTSSGAVDLDRVIFAGLHINAERWASDPRRASDHDPIWAALDLPALRSIYLPAITR